MKGRQTLVAPGDRLREWWAGRSRAQKWTVGVVGFAAMALLPLHTPGFLNTPGISFGGTMAQFAMVALIAIGLNVVVGQAGLLDLGYVGFYAVGAYTVALLTSPSSPWNKMSSTGFFSPSWAWLSCVPLAMARPTGEPGISQLPCKMCPYVPGSPTAQDSRTARGCAVQDVAFRGVSRRRRPEVWVFRGSSSLGP